MPTYNFIILAPMAGLLPLSHLESTKLVDIAVTYASQKRGRLRPKESIIHHSKGLGNWLLLSTRLQTDSGWYILYLRRKRKGYT